MLNKLLLQFKPAIIIFMLLALLTGFIYPLIMTGIAQLLFPANANGSLILRNNEAIGSLLIGQEFVDDKYFWGRPSATIDYPYNAQASSGSNAAPLNANYLQLVNERIQKLNAQQLIPVDLVTASASGLDPDISPYAAYFQIPRIAASRNIAPDRVKATVDKQLHKRLFGILGEPRVNVLLLNLALDEIKP